MPMVEVKQQQWQELKRIKFRECEELLHAKKLLLKIKGRRYQSCMRPALLYGSETWCLR